MGVVKYTGPVASFHCPTNAEIRSLKIHFSPKQLGEGDPSPENVREIVGWDGVVVHNDDGIVIPEEYQKVEYIRIMTNSYFNSGCVPVIAPRIITKIQIMTSMDADLFGFANNIEPSFIVDPSNYGDTWFQRWGKTSYTRISARKVETPIICEFGKQQIFDGEIKYTFPDTDWSSNSQSIRVGGARNINSDMKLYYCDIYDGTNLVCRFVPCRRKVDDTLGLYDSVNDIFLINQGSGALECGPDVGETVDYEFGVLGKNKFDYANADIVNRKRLDDNGNEVGDGTGSYCKLKIPVIPNKEYTLSGYTASLSKRIYYYNIDGDFISRSDTYSGSSFTFTTLSNCYYIQIQLNEESISGWDTMQLELGSTATAYESYDPNHTVYGGWVDLISGEVQEDGINGYPYYSIVLDGTEEWTLVKQNNEASIFKYYCGVSAKTESNSICSHFKMKLLSYKDLGYTNSFIHGMSGNLFIQPVNSIASTVEELQTYLASQYQNGTPVTVLFQADSTPNTYSLAPTQLQTFLGQNNIWSNADYVEVEYDLHETQEILNRKAFIMANQPHLVAPEAAQLQSFTTDLAAPLKECRVYFKPKQEGEGDPSPENIRPIEGWENIETYQAEEAYKLIPTDNQTSWFLNGITMDYLGNGKYHIYGKATEGGAIKCPSVENFVIPALSGKRFELHNNSTSSGSIHFYDGSNKQIDYWRFNSINRISNSYASMGGKTLASFGITFSADEEMDLTIEPFFLYNKVTIPITFPTEAGTIYGGYIDVKNGELVQEWASVVIDGTENWTTQAPHGDFARMFLCNPTNSTMLGNSSMSSSNGITDWLDTVKISGDEKANGRLCCRFGWSDRNFYILNAVENIEEVSDVTSLKSYLSQHPLRIVYKLATSVHYPISPTALKTLRGTNNIWSSANDKIEIKYWKH